MILTICIAMLTFLNSCRHTDYFVREYPVMSLLKEIRSNGTYVDFYFQYPSGAIEKVSAVSSSEMHLNDTLKSLYISHDSILWVAVEVVDTAGWEYQHRRYISCRYQKK
ncbi:MAG: hypothetical protein JWM20_40 [Patescibacteria group bacterium]|nr:hypothetical protein [Patescibacteria group bacterium]